MPLSAHPPAAHVRIEHGPPGPRLQFVPVRTAPIVGHLRLGNPIETFSRHTDSAADFVGAERAMEVFMAELSEDEKQSLDDALRWMTFTRPYLMLTVGFIVKKRKPSRS